MESRLLEVVGGQRSHLVEHSHVGQGPEGPVLLGGGTEALFREVAADVVERVAVEHVGQRGASDADGLEVLGAHHRAWSGAARLTATVVGDACVAHQTLTGGADARDPGPVAEALLYGPLRIAGAHAP